MSIPDTIAWSAGLLSFVGLIIMAQRGTSATLRAALSVIASAALAWVLAGSVVAMAFYAVNIVLALATWRFSTTRVWWIWIVLLVGLLAVSKLPIAPASGTGGQPAAAGIGLWLGFSYLVFRLIHITVERHAGRMGDETLAEATVYAMHPASFISGPIDRLPNSSKWQRADATVGDDFNQGVWRIVRGAFVKFVIANPLFAVLDSIGLTANPDQATGLAWLWLITYSFYILADFAGYTDIAIGFGRLAGLRLPENFERPYLAPNIAMFWQRWHITLSTWVRDYIFFPIARSLRARLDNRYRNVIQFVAHMITMGAVGLWHGLTPAFLVWGLWHGLGLFLHGQFGRRPPRGDDWRARLRLAFGVLTTYIFVTIGWVFFATDLPTALRILARLFGF